jgi:hypothetical protein
MLHTEDLIDIRCRFGKLSHLGNMVLRICAALSESLIAAPRGVRNLGHLCNINSTPLIVVMLCFTGVIHTAGGWNLY